MFEPSSCPVQDTPSASGDDSQATSGNETPDYPSNDAPASTDSDVPSATGDEVPETTGDDIQAAAAASVSYDYNATPYSPTDNEADAYPGKYNENPIISNDPDKGQFAYHRGIQVSWKDDVTQQNVTMGELHNGRDKDGNLFVDALLNNLGDIVLVPGKLYNWGVIVNESGANIYACDATEAIIPIEPPTPISTITSKRITLEPPVANLVENWGTIINRGGILPASVELLDNTGFGTLTEFGDHPELFQFINHGTVVNDGYIYGWDKPTPPAHVAEATTVFDRLATKLPASADATSAATVGSLLTGGLAAIFAGKRKRK